jgi:uncharacterized protein
MDAMPNAGRRKCRLRRPIWAIWLLLTGTYGVASFAAGFDCAKAATRVERAICASPDLSVLDGNLASAYAEALVVIKDGSKLRAEQRTWLAKRDECMNRVSVCDEASKIYEDRIAQLRKVVAERGTEASKAGKSDLAELSLATTQTGKAAPPVCTVLSSATINPFYPDQALRSVSGEIQPILDESYKSHIEGGQPPDEPLVFDFDNSGKPKKVLVVSWTSHMNSSDTYLAYDDEAWGLLTGASFKGAIQGRYATTVFPWVWENCKAWLARVNAAQPPNWPARTCPDPDADLPFVTPDSRGQPMHWRAAYLHLAPFTYRSATYFLLTTEDRALWAKAFVLKPMPQGRYELTCQLATTPSSDDDGDGGP